MADTESLDGRGGGGARPRSAESTFAGTARFEVRARLGSGAFGTVYEAYDRELRTTVALKVLYRREWKNIQRFKTEFRALASTRHPNLVSMHELFCEGDTWFFSMELIRGVDFLAATQGKSRDKVAGILSQLVAGLDALHRAGHLHRDIKPSNIIVDENGKVVILDFGLIVRVGEHTPAEEARAGTPGYMAPEVKRGASAGPPSDWYSVGVLLYEALTGVRHPDERAARLILGGPSSLIAYASPVHRDLEQLAIALLARDPQARPTAEVVLARLGAAAQARPRPLPVEPLAAPLIARERELALLAAAEARVQGGGAATVVVHGPSGVGKSALVDVFLGGLDDALVLRSRCHEREFIPFNAFDGITDDLARWLAPQSEEERAQIAPSGLASLLPLFPTLKTVFAAPDERAALDRTELRRRAFAALGELFARLARRARLVLVVDDVQWIDADSRALLEECFAAWPVDAPLLCLLVQRIDAPVPTCGERLTLPLAPLAVDDGRRLVEELLAELADRGVEPEPHTAAAVASIVGEAGGNPDLIIRLVRHLARGRGQDLERARALTDLVREELAPLSRHARALVEKLALVDRALQRDLAALLDNNSAHGLRDLAEIQRAGMISVRGTSRGPVVEMTHDRLRRAIVDTLDAGTRQRCHLEVAETLEGAGADAELLYPHFADGGRPEKASRYAEQAGDRAAAALAFVRAAELYGAALALEPSGERAFSVENRLADALAAAGQVAEAAPRYHALSSRSSGHAAARLRRQAMEQYLIGGQVERGSAVLEELARDLSLPLPRTPRGALLRALGVAMRLRLRGSKVRNRRTPPSENDGLRLDTSFSAAKGLIGLDPMRGTYFALRALDLALGSGDHERAARYLAYVGGILVAAGGGAERWGQSMLDAAARRLAVQPTPELEASLRIAESQVALVRGSWSSALALSDGALAILRDSRGGVAWEIGFAQMTALRALEELGDLAAVATRTDAFHREALATGNFYSEVTSLLYRTTVHLAADRVAEARSDADAVLARWTASGYHVQHLYALRAQVFADLADGDADAAWRRVQAEWPAIERSLIMRVPTGRVDAWLMRARAAVATRSPALRRIVDKGIRELTRVARPDAQAHADLLAAALLAQGGDGRAAAARIGIARERYAAQGMALAAAVCEARLAELSGDGAADSEGRGRLARFGVANDRRWLAIHAPGLASDQPKIAGRATATM